MQMMEEQQLAWAQQQERAPLLQREGAAAAEQRID